MEVRLCSCVTRHASEHWHATLEQYTSQHTTPTCFLMIKVIAEALSSSTGLSV